MSAYVYRGVHARAVVLAVYGPRPPIGLHILQMYGTNGLLRTFRARRPSLLICRIYYVYISLPYWRDYTFVYADCESPQYQQQSSYVGLLLLLPLLSLPLPLLLLLLLVMRRLHVPNTDGYPSMELYVLGGDIML
ncbi:unnamed protein product [Rangifer tarandus platyrhynchus]|uniref:Uncharacterized protein n=1 Tax=Rangifer tarandus platyrhynchus TaxID=3082113 RepID=A0ABN8XLL7_RANTA|nr:unnamed protein product [Rangifer tarandus platyrhynchus]